MSFTPTSDATAFKFGRAYSRIEKINRSISQTFYGLEDREFTPESRLAALRKCDADLMQASELYTACPEPERLVRAYRTSLKLATRVHLEMSEIFHLSGSFGERDRFFAMAERESVECWDRYRASHMAHRAHARIVKATFYPENAAPVLREAEVMLKRALGTYRQNEGHKVYCVVGEFYSAAAVLVPEQKDEMLANAKAAFHRAADMSTQAAEKIERICMRWFNRPTVPDFLPAEESIPKAEFA